MSALQVSVLVIGDEILSGYVTDTNSPWIAQRLRPLGVPLERVVTVPDDLGAISEALLTELARARPRLVLTSGGIGSTPDDCTIEAVAAALERPLRVEPGLDDRITAALEWTARRGVPISEAHERGMRKMALVPEGARVLPAGPSGAAGMAPGIAVELDGGCRETGGATIVVLPGVPAELRRIVTEQVEPQLLAGRGTPQHTVELRHPYPESTLNPVFEEVLAAHPSVRLGSYPGAECLVRLSGPAEAVQVAAETVRSYLQALSRDEAMDDLRVAWRARWTADEGAEADPGR